MRRWPIVWGFGKSWELEDLGFRFAEPDLYRQIAKWLDEKRTEREDFVAKSIERLQTELKALHIKGQYFRSSQTYLQYLQQMKGKSLQFCRFIRHSRVPHHR